ncbi:MAG: hypothetical protein EOO38_01450 [Cytophagaceae bacterium]|nr:MAG: hypothetical protein EOO38_01450 [Cytophagaceae bacterium]
MLHQSPLTPTATRAFNRVKMVSQSMPLVFARNIKMACMPFAQLVATLKKGRQKQSPCSDTEFIYTPKPWHKKVLPDVIFWIGFALILVTKAPQLFIDIYQELRSLVM